MNRFSPAPLPFLYQTPEQRFDAELTTLVAAPPFKIAPAATVGLDQFHSAVDGKSALILDARPSVFFENGHVPGALNLARRLRQRLSAPDRRAAVCGELLILAEPEAGVQTC